MSSFHRRRPSTNERSGPSPWAGRNVRSATGWLKGGKDLPSVGVEVKILVGGDNPADGHLGTLDPL